LFSVFTDFAKRQIAKVDKKKERKKETIDCERLPLAQWILKRNQANNTNV